MGGGPGGQGEAPAPPNNWDNPGEKGQNRAKTYVLLPQYFGSVCLTYKDIVRLEKICDGLLGCHDLIKTLSIDIKHFR